MLFKKLCLKLDAFSHFHFTHKPVVEDMSIQTNVPALAMEEIAPMALSDAAMLAPEEVYSGKGDIKEEAELMKAERKRRRANKKRKFKEVFPANDLMHSFSLAYNSSANGLLRVAEAAKRMGKKPRDNTTDGKDSVGEAWDGGRQGRHRVVGLARAMIKHALKVEGLNDAVDIVGTGGDGANTVNISTGSLILAAACGAKVARVTDNPSF
ncbi:hypothetical protein V6N13_035313 [Hibiscus sabdariffa]